MDPKTLADVKKKIHSIVKLLECSICLELLNSPVSTGCGHFFCRFCITKLMNNEYRSACPLCDHPFTRRSIQDAVKHKSIVLEARKFIEDANNITQENFWPSKSPLKEISMEVGSRAVNILPETQESAISKKRKSNEIQDMPNESHLEKHGKSFSSGRDDSISETTESGLKRYCTRTNDESKFSDIENSTLLPSTIPSTSVEDNDIITPTQTNVKIAKNAKNSNENLSNTESCAQVKTSLAEKSDCEIDKILKVTIIACDSDVSHANLKSKRKSCKSGCILSPARSTALKMKKNALRNTTNCTDASKLVKLRKNRDVCVVKNDIHLKENKGKNMKSFYSPVNKRMKSFGGIEGRSKKDDNLDDFITSVTTQINEDSVVRSLVPDTILAKDAPSVDCLNLQQIEISQSALHREDDLKMQSMCASDKSVTVEAVDSPDRNKNISISKSGWSRVKQDGKDFRTKIFTRLNVKKKQSLSNQKVKCDTSNVLENCNSIVVDEAKTEYPSLYQSPDEIIIETIPLHVPNETIKNSIISVKNASENNLEKIPQLEIDVQHTIEPLTSVLSRQLSNFDEQLQTPKSGSGEVMMQVENSYQNEGATPLSQMTRVVSKNKLASKFNQISEVMTTEIPCNEDDVFFVEHSQQTTQSLIKCSDDLRFKNHLFTSALNVAFPPWHSEPITAHCMNTMGPESHCEKTKVLKRTCLTLDEINENFSESSTSGRTKDICNLPFSSDFRLHICVSDGTLNISVLRVLEPNTSFGNNILMMSDKSFPAPNAALQNISHSDVLPSSNPGSDCSQSSLVEKSCMQNNPFPYLNNDCSEEAISEAIANVDCDNDDKRDMTRRNSSPVNAIQRPVCGSEDTTELITTQRKAINENNDWKQHVEMENADDGRLEKFNKSSGIKSKLDKEKEIPIHDNLKKNAELNVCNLSPRVNLIDVIKFPPMKLKNSHQIIKTIDDASPPDDKLIFKLSLKTGESDASTKNLTERDKNLVAEKDVPNHSSNASNEGQSGEMDPFENLPKSNISCSVIEDSDEHSSDPDMDFANELVAPLKHLAENQKESNAEPRCNLSNVSHSVNELNKSVLSSRLSLKQKKASSNFKRIVRDSDSESSNDESSPMNNETRNRAVEEGSPDTFSEDLTSVSSCKLATELEDLDNEIKSVKEKLKQYGYSGSTSSRTETRVSEEQKNCNEAKSRREIFRSDDSNDSIDLFIDSVPPTP